MPVNVTLVLRGLVVLAAKKGETQGKVGIIRTFPLGHDLTITVRKTPPDDDDIVLPRQRIKRDLSLEITPATAMTIRDETPVNRNAPVQHPASIAWFVDLENQELHNKPVNFNPGDFSSILTLNSGGEIFTAEAPNQSVLQIIRPGSINFEDFGHVALAFGIDFNSVTTAVFRNGPGAPGVVFDSSTESKTHYLITIDHDATIHPPISTDANFYYTAAQIPLEERFFFMSTGLGTLVENVLLLARSDEQRLRGHAPALAVLQKLIERVQDIPLLAGPEAACFPAYASRSTF